MIILSLTDLLLFQTEQTNAHDWFYTNLYTESAGEWNRVKTQAIEDVQKGLTRYQASGIQSNSEWL